MASVDVAKVLSVAPNGTTTVLGTDGNTYTLSSGTRSWRDNNPGNIEYGNYAISQGAVGSDGRFAIFPNSAMGRAAQENLQFNTPSYADKTIQSAISAYAPPNENNSSAYAAALAESLGVSPDTKLSDLTPSQRSAYLDAQQRQEGMIPGTISGNGQTYDPNLFWSRALADPLPAPTPLIAGSSPVNITVHGGAQTAAPQSGSMVTLASGKQIAPGIYNQGDHSVSVTNDGNGNAVIQRISGPGSIPGIIDPMQEANADTVAGGMIRSMIPQGLAGLGNSLTTTAGNVKDTALNAATNLGGQIQGLGSNLFSGFNNLFGNTGASGLGALSAGGGFGTGMGGYGLASLTGAPTPFPYPSFYGLQALPPAQPIMRPAPPPQAAIPSAPVGTQFLNDRGISTANQTAGQVANALNAQLSGSHHGSFGV